MVTVREFEVKRSIVGAFRTDEPALLRFRTLHRPEGENHAGES